MKQDAEVLLMLRERAKGRTQEQAVAAGGGLAQSSSCAGLIARVGLFSVNISSQQRLRRLTAAVGFRIVARSVNWSVIEPLGTGQELSLLRACPDQRVVGFAIGDCRLAVGAVFGMRVGVRDQSRISSAAS